MLSPVCKSNQLCWSVNVNIFLKCKKFLAYLLSHPAVDIINRHLRDCKSRRIFSLGILPGIGLNLLNIYRLPVEDGWCCKVSKINWRVCQGTDFGLHDNMIQHKFIHEQKISDKIVSRLDNGCDHWICWNAPFYMFFFLWYPQWQCICRSDFVMYKTSSHLRFHV